MVLFFFFFFMSYIILKWEKIVSLLCSVTYKIGLKVNMKENCDNVIKKKNGDIFAMSPRSGYVPAYSI